MAENPPVPKTFAKRVCDPHITGEPMRLPVISGEEVVKILVKKFGFRVARQRGSHVVLIKYVGSEKIGTVVPLHPELKRGTLLGILEKARITKEEFVKAYEEDP